MTPSHLGKIDRYLDVTKSAFLFGGRTLLVAGMTEAMLFSVPAFTRHPIETTGRQRRSRLQHLTDKRQIGVDRRLRGEPVLGRSACASAGRTTSCCKRKTDGRSCRWSISRRDNSAGFAFRYQVASPWSRPLRLCRGATRRATGAAQKSLADEIATLTEHQ